jgi:hypothetical protein
MKKRLLSAVLALVLCAYPAMAADFGTLTISSDREVIDDSVLYELAEADEPSTLTLRTPDGETGSLTFNGTEYHLQPCGQTDEFAYSVLFSADGENAYGLPYTEWFMADSDIGQHIFDPVTETGPDRFIRTEWTQLVPLPTNDLRTLSLTLINASGEQRPLFTFLHPVTYLTLPSIV